MCERWCLLSIWQVIINACLKTRTNWNCQIRWICSRKLFKWDSILTCSRFLCLLFYANFVFVFSFSFSFFFLSFRTKLLKKLQWCLFSISVISLNVWWKRHHFQRFVATLYCIFFIFTFSFSYIHTHIFIFTFLFLFLFLFQNVHWFLNNQ